MSNEPPNGNTLLYRVHLLEQRLQRLESLEPAVQAERIAMHGREFQELRDEVRALKRALYSFAFSITAGAVIFAVGILQVVH